MKNRQRQKDTLFSILIFCSAFAVNLLIQKLFTTQTLVPMIFVFGVFLISLKTHGYCYGITSAIVSVFAVNFAFTYPYYVFDFFVGESILSAVIMLAVAVFTSTLNSRIRDQEKLRAENEKERMRGNLLRAISHDLRTPLTSIYGSSSTLISKYDALPKEQQLKLLGEIQEDSEWLIRMVENLLSVTRIDGAKVEVVKTPTVLDELIDSVLMKFSKKYPNQKVITQIPEEFVDIPMDSLLIEQVLLNLLENAVFHAKGMTELTLSVSLVGDKAVFEVADNGCGLPEDALQKIFTGSYEKSAAPVDGTRSNMGIGLSVCAAIVKACVDSAFQLGLPEARIPLAEAIILMATAPKSNSAINGIDAAIADIRAGRAGDIPAHLKDAHYGGAKKLGRGLTYQYPHMYPNHWVQQEYLPEELRGAQYYEYGPNKTEQAAKAYWNKVKGSK